MSISGSLQTMGLPEIFQWLGHNRKTGTLMVSDNNVEKHVFLQNGLIISSASSSPTEYLGHFLVAHGYISELELAKAMEVQDTSKTLLGKILVTLGVITQEHLESMMRLKSEESIFDLFTWDDGHFTFTDGELPPYKMIPIALDVETLLLRGAQRIDEWRQIRQWIPEPVGAVPFVVDELEIPDDDPQARMILECVDNERTIEAIGLEVHTSQFQVCRVLARELERETLKLVHPPRPAAPPKPKPQAPPPPVQMPPPPPMTPIIGAIDDGSPLAPVRRNLMAGDLTAAFRQLDTVRRQNPDSMLLHDQIQAIERRIRDEVAAIGIQPAAVPQRARTNEELTRARLSPQELFILSRINGEYDVQTILKICPMPPLEALVVFRNLLLRGHIRVEFQSTASAG
jgi:hypothetical protein